MKPSDKVINFIETYCTHTKGKWAGTPFKLLPWQREFICKAYDTLKPDGTRRYRFVYLEIPKKNGKTELAAALMLYQLLGDSENAPEVYMAAANRDQASICFDACNVMIKNNPKLGKRLDVLDSRKRVVDYKGNGFIQVLSRETSGKSGVSPSAVTIDELHEHKDGQLYEIMTAETDAAREQQIVFVLTTAGVYDPESIWFRIREHAIKVRDGIIDDPSFLPVLYIADPDADPADEKLWAEVNPSMGHIFTLDKIRENYNRVKDNPVDLASFKRFRLNIPAQSISQWIPVDVWDKNGGEIDESMLYARDCYAGLDLSSVLDLSALVYAFKPDDLEQGTIDILCRFFMPEENIMKRVKEDRVPYDIWASEGWLTLTPGRSIDHDTIVDTLRTDGGNFNIRELAFDRWGAARVVSLLEELGFEPEDRVLAQSKLIMFGQGYASMSSPMKETDKMLRGGRFNHGNNPILRWNANNVYAEVNAVDQIKPNKGKSIERIDGVVAMIMAVDRLTRAMVQDSGPLITVI